MAEELIGLRAAIQHELELARSGDGYEEKAVADEIVDRFVLPLLEPMRAKHYTPYVDEDHQGGYCFDFFGPTLARVAHAERERGLSDKRVAYLEARVGELHNTIGEQRAELERWRSGQRQKAMPVVKEVPDGITYAARLLRAQGTEGGDEHDELLRNAGARLATLTDVARRLLVDRDRVEASRQAWAEEAMAVREKLARLENMVLNRSAALFSGILVGVGGEHDTPPNDEQTWRAVGLIERAIRREMGPGYIAQSEERLVSAVESNGVCACVTDEQAAQIESAGPLWVRPQCAVHPTGGEA